MPTSPLLFWTLAALAYETDQLTDRHHHLADATEAANAHADRAIADAVAETNARLGCEASLARTERVLMRQIWKRTAALESVPERGGLRAKGFTVYSAWMESDPTVDRHAFDDRRDVYGDVGIGESLVLATAGTNSTFELAGVRVGSDKAEHFFDLGYRYLKHSDDGEHPERGVALGVRTEHGKFGTATSRTFSYADLAANHAGYAWYARLLTSDSEVQLDDQGCVAVVGSFDWAEWVTWEWDEVLNPSRYTPEVERAVQRQLAVRRDAVCAGYAAWGGQDHEDHLARVLSHTPAHAEGAPTDRWDPYRLDALCAAAPATALPRGGDVTAIR